LIKISSPGAIDFSLWAFFYLKLQATSKNVLKKGILWEKWKTLNERKENIYVPTKICPREICKLPDESGNISMEKQSKLRGGYKNEYL